MSEEEWNEESAVPPKKKGIPSWVLFCSGGCLITLVLTITAAFLLFNRFKAGIDPEQQWQRIEKVVQLDARPPELQLMFGWDLFMDFWWLRDSRGYIVVIYDFGENQASERDALFSEEFKGGGLPGLSTIEDAALGEVRVQGRLLPVQHFRNTGGFNPGGNDGVKGGGAACFVDITPEDDPGFVMLFMMRDPSRGKDDLAQPVPAEAIEELLRPFNVGPEHQTYVAPGPHPQAGKSEVEFEEIFKD